ncbi:hypothetical protein PCANC_19918 [Puccinia coronata f. sp. avenae]|uniref:Uncharacterized protein n=1 Tax=Puccinia coronata f. sp. avenae TaxID=200324 RepID=A0A2N5U333_9BASI|nr:hypothetical protein PCANC_19918 [Puccinia coronata f. sp. avenae]
MSDKPVRQVCPTWDRTILSDAISNKPTGWVCPTWDWTMASDPVSNPHANDLLEQAGLLCVCEPNDKLFTKQANDLLGKELAEQVNDLLMYTPARVGQHVGAKSHYKHL